MTVDVYETDFKYQIESVTEITAEDRLLSAACDPGVADGNAFYTCISNVPVTDLVTSSGDLSMAASGTADVNQNPYEGYYFYLRFTLTRMENTLFPYQYFAYEGGTNDAETGVSYTFTELDTDVSAYTLTVQVYNTDFISTNEYVRYIYASSTVLSTHCNPSGSGFYSCIYEVDVTKDISSDGDLTILTQATWNVNANAHYGYVFYVRYLLQENAIQNDSNNDDNSSKSVGLIVGIVVPSVICIIIVVWIWHCSHQQKLKKNRAQDASGNQALLVETETPIGATTPPLATVDETGNGISLQTYPQLPQQQPQLQGSPPTVAYDTSPSPSSHRQLTLQESPTSTHCAPMEESSHLVSPTPSAPMAQAYLYPSAVTHTVENS